MNNNIIQLVSSIRKNPNQIGQILYQKGKINKEQFSDIQGKSPQEVGEYLLNNNILSNNVFNQLQQQVQQFSGLFK